MTTNIKKRLRLPRNVHELLGWINAAGLLPQAIEACADKNDDDAFIALHERMEAEHLCPEAMELFEDMGEDERWLLTNELILRHLRSKARR